MEREVATQNQAPSPGPPRLMKTPAARHTLSQGGEGSSHKLPSAHCRLPTAAPSVAESAR